MSETEFFERQLVVFKVGNEEFGIDISDVQEIMRFSEVTILPGSDPFVEGIINLRGGIVTIIDLAKKIGLQSSEISPQTRIIVTKINESITGFIVDSCNDVLRITGDKIQDAPPIVTDKVDSQYILGVGVLDERLITIIDFGKIVLGKDAYEKKGTAEKTILIAEDSTMMRGTIKSYIDRGMYNIIESGDGEETISMIKSEKPDILLLDIKMPKKNGVEVLEWIEKNAIDIDVIMETSVYEEDTKQKCLTLGAKAYLKKPISKNKLNEIIQGLNPKKIEQII